MPNSSLVNLLGQPLLVPRGKKKYFFFVLIFLTSLYLSTDLWHWQVSLYPTVHRPLLIAMIDRLLFIIDASITAFFLYFCFSFHFLFHFLFCLTRRVPPGV
ncbi:hypothetical protein BC940DRAFT_303373 [Gongronella butleri]|nr:hypothetical protein BC940DRAFT_303373 [Gongronella butleri]